MQTRTVGTLEVTVVGLGCDNFGMKTGEEDSLAVVRAALDAGINHFDTADEYGGTLSEQFLGRALAGHREEAVIATKFGAMLPPDGSRPASPGWARRACEDSLDRLGTDYIDLYVLHHPDPKTPIGDTLLALGELVQEGKVREIGCSNFSGAMLEDATKIAEDLGVPKFVNIQNNYSLLERTPELEVIPACRQLGISFTPYFPLASGLLTGKYKRGEPPEPGTRMSVLADHFPDLWSEECLDIVDQLTSYAASHGHSLLELALSWLVSDPLVSSVIAGATSVEQVQANAQAAIAWELSSSERAEVAAMTLVDRSFATPIELQDGPLHRD